MNVFIKDLGISNGRNEYAQRTEEEHYEYFKNAYGVWVHPMTKIRYK
jgi:hypothetical protein